MNDRSTLERLIKVRKEIKKKKPKFVIQDRHKKAKLKDRWRKPKGLHSKMRLQKKGYRKIVKVGYGKPLRGYIDKYIPYHIISKKDFDVFVNEVKDKESYILILNSNFSMKTLKAILERCLEMNFKVYNFNVKRKLDSINKKLEEKKKKRVEEDKKKEERKKEEKLKKKEDKKIKEEGKKINNIKEEEAKEKAKLTKEEEKIKEIVEKTTPKK